MAAIYGDATFSGLILPDLHVHLEETQWVLLKSRDITLPTKVHLVKAVVFPVVMNRCESWTIKKAEHQRTDFFKCGVGENFWEFLGLQGDQTSQSWRKSTRNIHWKDWCWSWSTNTLASWSEELTPWKRPWSWERLRAGGEVGDRGWDSWIALYWLNGHEFELAPGESEGKGRLACCSLVGLRVGHDWMTEQHLFPFYYFLFYDNILFSYFQVFIKVLLNAIAWS